MPAQERKNPSFKFLAAPVRLWTNSVTEPSAIDFGNGHKSEPMYHANVIVPAGHPEFSALKMLMKQVAMEKWGTIEGVSFPLRAGQKIIDAEAKKENGKDYTFLAGAVVLKTYSKKYAPALAAMRGGKVFDVTADMAAAAKNEFFYSGVDASVEVTLVANDGNGRNIPNSVTAYLSAVCSLCKGERLGGGGAASRFSEFARNMGQVSDQNPTAGMDAEIPF